MTLDTRYTVHIRGSPCGVRKGESWIFVSEERLCPSAPCSACRADSAVNEGLGIRMFPHLFLSPHVNKRHRRWHQYAARASGFAPTIHREAQTYTLTIHHSVSWVLHNPTLLPWRRPSPHSPSPTPHFCSSQFLSFGHNRKRANLTYGKK